MEDMRPDVWMPSPYKHLIVENGKYWKDDPGIVEGKGWIYVFHMRQPFELCVSEDVVAKGLQKRVNLPIASITERTFIKRFDELDASFGIKERFQIPQGRCVNLRSRIRTYLWAKYFALTTYKKKKQLLGIRYRGISCGNAIWDEIIRYDVGGEYYTQDKNVFDCFGIDCATYFQYIRNAFALVDQSYEIFKKRKPEYYITTEFCFIRSLCGYVARAMGAKLLLAGGSVGKSGTLISCRDDIFTGRLLKNEVEHYLENHGIAENEVSDENNVFLIKCKKTLEELPFKNMTGKRTVFIMVQGLSDAPRESYRQFAYNDYTEWFLDTLRIIKTIPDVNWIMKDHPLSESLKQTLYVKKAFEENKTENMYWCDKDINGVEIKEIADCIITCGGTAGLEYWAYGIPTITTAEGFYVPWGISYNMKSRKEYEDALRNLDRLPKPPEPSVKMARKYLLALKKARAHEDCLGKLFQKAFSDKMEGCYNKVNGVRGDEFGIDYWFCGEYIALLKNDGIRASEIYQLSDLMELS